MNYDTCFFSFNPAKIHVFQFIYRFRLIQVGFIYIAHKLPSPSVVNALDNSEIGSGGWSQLSVA